MAVPDPLDQTEDDGLLHANGIDALTGMPAAAPIAAEDAMGHDASAPRDAAATGRLAKLWGMFTKKLHGLPEDLEEKANDPAAVGWAIAFASDTPSEVRTALEPLIAHRRDHARIQADRLKVLEYPPGRSLEDWLGGIKAHAGPTSSRPGAVLRPPRGRPGIDPVRAPDALDVHYAVGRLSFDHPEEYRRMPRASSPTRPSTTAPTRNKVAYWGTRTGPTGPPRSSQTTSSARSSRASPPPTAREGRRPSRSRGFRSRSSSAPGHAPTSPRCSMASTRPAGPRCSSPPRTDGLARAIPTAVQQGALLCQDWPGLGSRHLPRH